MTATVIYRQRGITERDQEPTRPYRRTNRSDLRREPVRDFLPGAKFLLNRNVAPAGLEPAVAPDPRLAQISAFYFTGGGDGAILRGCESTLPLPVKPPRERAEFLPIGGIKWVSRDPSYRVLLFLTGNSDGSSCHPGVISFCP